MKITRRNLMTGAGMAGMAIAMTPAIKAIAGTAGQKATLAIYDSRVPQSRVFAREVAGQGITTIDIAGEDAMMWRTIRKAAKEPGDVIGLTRWSDLVLVRGYFEEGGKRMSHEVRPESQRPGTITTFLWRMDSARSAS
ncbi:hypothetical protein [Emcibacter sp.]|uniref:hypothetical protein n=1 Tax=Emcibacter sp. TaxID=1979954 RepID=UPI002AA90CF7|nr:hypothetical protein [Emcibacter sp.]